MAEQVKPDIYRYTAELQYIKDDKPKIFDSKHIKSIVIDYDYEKNNMPLIYLNIALDKGVLDDMIINNGKGLVNFTIYKYISNNETTSVKTIYIRDQFVYFIGDDINFKKEIDAFDKKKQDEEQLFKVINIGLMKLDHLNKNKKSFGGIYNGTTMINMIQIATSHLPILIEPITYNTSLKQIIVPPTRTVSSMLKFLNNIAVFYDTPYRFFMDFDTTYLLSSSGKPVLKKGEKNACNSVSISIRSTATELAKIQGMTTDNKQKIYKIEFNSVDTAMNVNRGIEKSYNNITTIETTNTSGTSKINVNNSEYMNSHNKLIRVQNNNTNMISNIKSSLQLSAITIDINKNDLDSSVFTINKEYHIKDHDVYGPEYDGRYLLARKRELYIREDETYIMNTMLTMKQLKS